MGNDPKIPSVISYAAQGSYEQGFGKSLPPDSAATINTKLELDVHDNKTDELELLLAVLENMSNLNFEQVKTSKGCPQYIWKSPEEIVTDYLTEIYKVVDKEVNNSSAALRADLPVDIVITIPVVIISACLP